MTWEGFRSATDMVDEPEPMHHSAPFFAMLLLAVIIVVGIFVSDSAQAPSVVAVPADDGPKIRQLREQIVFLQREMEGYAASIVDRDKQIEQMKQQAQERNAEIERLRKSLNLVKSKSCKVFVN